MIRRPNAFQRGARSALADNLVEPSGPMPGLRPQAGGGVGMPQGLPGLIPYGPQPQGLLQNSRFSGGSVPSPLSLTRPEPPPNFAEPNFGTGAPPQNAAGPVHALSPLIQALTSASSLPPHPTGATAGGAGAAVGGAGTVPAPPAWTGTGFVPLPPGPGPGPSSLGPPGPTQPTNPAAGLSALIAALAGKGMKVGSGGGNIRPHI